MNNVTHLSINNVTPVRLLPQADTNDQYNAQNETDQITWDGMTNQIWFATGVTTDEVTIAELTLTNDATGNASYIYADDSQTDYYSTSMTISNGVVTLSSGGSLMTNMMVNESNPTEITDVNGIKHKLHINGKL